MKMIKGWLKKIKDFFRKHFLLCALGIVILVPVLCYLIVCWIECKLYSLRELGVDQWATLLGGGLSYIGTCGVGILALWQNVRLTQINESLLMLEYNRDKPILRFGLRYERFEDGMAKYRLEITNHGTESFRDCTIQRVVVSSKKIIQEKERTIYLPLGIGPINPQNTATEPLKLFNSKTQIEIGDSLYVKLQVSIVGRGGKEWKENLFFWFPYAKDDIFWAMTQKEFDDVTESC